MAWYLRETVGPFFWSRQSVARLDSSRKSIFASDIASCDKLSRPNLWCFSWWLDDRGRVLLIYRDVMCGCRSHKAWRAWCTRCPRHRPGTRRAGESSPPKTPKNWRALLATMTRGTWERPGTDSAVTQHASFDHGHACISHPAAQKRPRGDPPSCILHRPRSGSSILEPYCYIYLVASRSILDSV